MKPSAPTSPPTPTAAADAQAQAQAHAHAHARLAGPPAPRRPSLWQRLLLNEDLNFLLTNRIPRAAFTHAMGRFSRIRSPWLTRCSLAVWRWFTPLDLSDAAHTRFESLHDCFTRALKPGARPFDPRPDWLCSPSDGIVGQWGAMDGMTLLQAKGFPYTLPDLLGSEALAQRYRDGQYLTLRLTSGMYHRFHAPADLTLERVTYISGDTWNVNPIALRRVQRLFCKNERAVLETRLHHRPARMALVPVAAILVASIRLHAVNVRLHLRYAGPNVIPCNAAVRKGDELGWFEHGSTLILLVPPGAQLAPGLDTGHTVRAGQPLWHWPAEPADTALATAAADPSGAPAVHAGPPPQSSAGG